MEKNDKKFAVLIDADNISSKKIKIILDEIANFGTPTIKRIYGDFTDPRLASWKEVLLDNSIIPIQQYANTIGKNATDSALIIDAMDILHKESVDGFCIISSDSDFTRLASRIRESGKEVLGFGEKKTPKPFVRSCTQFKYVEILDAQLSDEPSSAAKVVAQKSKSSKSVRASVGKTAGAATVQAPDKAFISLLQNTIDNISDENGWAFLGVVGNIITKKMPDFDPRNYGFVKLTPLLKSMSDLIEIEERTADMTGIKHIYIRNKPRK